MDGDAFTQHWLMPLQSIFLGNVVSNTNTFVRSTSPSQMERNGSEKDGGNWIAGDCFWGVSLALCLTTRKLQSRGAIIGSRWQNAW
jgi:hypothetical protein